MRGAPPLVLSIESASGRTPLIVDEPVVVNVSLRGRLPPAPLRWTLQVGGRPKARGGIERLGGDVPRREFDISTVVDHEDFSAVGGPAPSPSPGRRSAPGPQVRIVRFRLAVLDAGGGTVVTAYRDAAVTCATDDTHPSCR
jgi:hypothetical protein